MGRLAVPAALVAAVAIFAGFFVLLTGANPLVQLGLPALLAAGGAVGTYLLLGHTKAQADSAAYGVEARGKVREVTQKLDRASGIAKHINNPAVRADVAQAVRLVPELLRRVAEAQPNSLYSSASKFGGHASSLLGIVEQYADIERNPDFYQDAPRLLTEGQAALSRFTEFAQSQMRLVNQGDMAEYQANLDTVAPPQLPSLEG